MRACGEVKKAIGETEEEVRIKVDCQDQEISVLTFYSPFGCPKERFVCLPDIPQDVKRQDVSFCGNTNPHFIT